MINQLKYVAGLLVVAILIYSALWYTAAFQAEKHVKATFSQWRDSGLLIEHGKIEHGGFPYRITVSVKDFTFATRAEGLKLAADKFMLISHLWTPNHWIINASGVTGGLAAGATTFRDGFLHGSYKLHDNGKILIVINSRGVDDFTLLRLMGQEGPKLKTWELAFWLDDPSAKPEGGLYGSRFLNFKISGAAADTKLVLTGGVSGPIVRDWRKDMLANWRDQGGLIELDTLTAKGANGAVTGNASITLDDKFRPLGSASLTLTGAPNLTGLIQGFGVQPDVTPRDTGPASVMLQNGTLSLNGRQIATLKPVLD